MKNKLAALAFAGASLAMFAGAPSAGAAHCVEGDSPGFSYFGTDHVGEREGGNERVQADGTAGASSCRDTGSPSERAPGQNR